jgi:branched-chain amino acid transport system permease protein
MEQYYGYFLYALSLLAMGGIYSILTLGLNIQWGFTGLFNAGVAGFFAIGAYVAAILCTPESPYHLGGYGMPLAVGSVAAMIASGIIAYVIGRICIRLRSDYLAIATIGISEIMRLVVKNEVWATNGPRGITRVPKAFETWDQPLNHIAFTLLVLVTVLAIYLLLERARTSPWGRVMAAIRDNEDAAAASGKNVERLRLEAFVLGSMLMGLAGSYMAQYIKFVDPNSFDPLTATFLVWVMLIVGGSANNKGAILGAFLMWVIWSATELITSRLPGEYAIRAAYLRVFLIGLALQFVLQKFPRGILPEKRPASGPRVRPSRARATLVETSND